MDQAIGFDGPETESRGAYEVTVGRGMLER